MEVSDRLVEQLQRTLELPSEQIRRVLSELVWLLNEDESAYVRRRHAELQGQIAGSEIWGMLTREVEQQLFRGRSYSERQLRRLVYGS